MQAVLHTVREKRCSSVLPGWLAVGGCVICEEDHKLHPPLRRGSPASKMYGVGKDQSKGGAL